MATEMNWIRAVIGKGFFFPERNKGYEVRVHFVLMTVPGICLHLASQGLSNSELPRACKKSTVPNKECGVGLRTFSSVHLKG
jgi:hypothetical protein